MALRRAWIPTRNYSSRGGAGVRLVVLHTAEGARTYQSLGSFFQGNVQASSHVGIDDTRGTIGEYVRRSDNAWTQANFNRVAVSVELCAFAKWSTAEWNQHPNMLANVAEWIAEECKALGLPITRLSAQQAQGSGRGVCQHVDLGAGGGGHWDCGPGFPMDRVLEMARGGGGAGPAPPPIEEVPAEMIASCVSASGTLHVFVATETAIFYTYQPGNSNNWNGGKPGQSVAGLSRLCGVPDNRKLTGISAAVAKNGVMHVFARSKDGTTLVTWQRPNETNWSGGAPGKGVAALSYLAPKP